MHYLLLGRVLMEVLLINIVLDKQFYFGLSFISLVATLVT